MRIGLAACFVAGLAFADAVSAQSLLLRTPEGASGERTPPPPGAPASATPASGSLYATSIIAVRPPDPRTFREHDLITIIIDEVSTQRSDQKLDTEKEVEFDERLESVLSPTELLEFRLREADSPPTSLLNLDIDNEFESEGEFERTDRFQARITAEVLEVRPNGTLVLEARSTIDTGGESLALLLSGVCRPEDVTDANTILSSQLADKTLVTRHEGELEKSTKKGVFTRALETLFAF